MVRVGILPCFGRAVGPAGGVETGLDMLVGRV